MEDKKKMPQNSGIGFKPTTSNRDIIFAPGPATVSLLCVRRSLGTSGVHCTNEMTASNSNQTTRLSFSKYASPTESQQRELLAQRMVVFQSHLTSLVRPEEPVEAHSRYHGSSVLGSMCLFLMTTKSL
jgi:hypothetical protein